MNIGAQNLYSSTAVRKSPPTISTMTGASGISQNGTTNPLNSANSMGNVTNNSTATNAMQIGADYTFNQLA